MAHWNCGAKLTTGGVTFIQVEAANEAEASARAASTLTERGYPVQRVNLCSRIETGIHHLVAAFLPLDAA